ncbi:hypothetical protein MUO74_02335 [Candidatus Bathyarchaeota archaeon]|nr:hypothetical protein [Candidatus Bathyarchaeota archaeon]
MSKTANSTTRVSSLVLMVIMITIALSLTALILAINAYSAEDSFVALWLILVGFIGVGLSAYVLLQMKRRVTRANTELPPITTTVECKKCGFKNVREFQRGDYIFKDVEPCQKCNEKMMITAIYREIKDREKEKFRF